jgi:hypothetical protein
MNCTLEDEYGNVSSKQILRPKIAHFLYEYLPLIDEHNKHHLITTLAGMCVVDLHYLYHSKYQNIFADLDIPQFSDLLCKNLKERSIRQHPRAGKRAGANY